MIVGIPVTAQVKQTITATVTTVGTYNISTVANGVTFSKSGTFAATGAQTIILDAAGTPAAPGSHSFALNTTPSCSFSRTTAPVQITAIDSISTVANGVTFSKSGTFAGTGPQAIILDAVGTPAAAGSHNFALNTTPSCSFSRITTSTTSGGTGVVSGYVCNTASAGNMIAGTPVSAQVKQTITATVTTVGTYSISTVANGVTFSKSGTFTGTGPQAIILDAIGTPAAAGSHNFALNTTPTCSFSRTTTSTTSGGTGIVSGYVCNTASAGNMIAGTPVSAQVKQTITATVTTVGTYSISTVANGVTFSKSGTFTATGPQAIILDAVGTPTAAGSHSFALNTTPSCAFSRITTSTTSGGTGIVSGYVCDTASAGTMIAGTPVTSQVKQIITATVTTVGTYNISTVANGVTFSNSGTFTATGAQTIILDAVGTPAATGSHSFALNTTPSCSFSRVTISTTSGGTGVVSGYVCNTASTGTMIAGIPVTAQVKQTITATVTTAGTYNISTVANGVTFSKSGTFAGTGAQTIILDATGTPTATGSHSFTLNTTPSCSFSRTTVPLQITAIDCTGQDAGVLRKDEQPGGLVTRRITATANAAGTFTIETNTVNGVQFTKTETFVSAGTKTVTLVAIGTPTAPATSVTFTIQGVGGGCTFTRIITGDVGDGTVVTATGRIWIDRNLGASQVATSSGDHLAYGSLFQWGRRADGHEQITWHSSTSGTPLNGNTTTVANNDNPYPLGNGLFIGGGGLATLHDWRSPQNDNLWQGVSGINNPCPSGYRIPTGAEWRAEMSASGAEITNVVTAATHVLKLPAAGYKYPYTMVVQGTYGYYWTSDLETSAGNTHYAKSFSIAPHNSGTGMTGYGSRDHAKAVRCIKD